MTTALLIRDEYMGLIWIYTMSSRSKVMDALKRFSTYIKRQWGLEICRIRRDNDRAFGSAYVTWVASEGI